MSLRKLQLVEAGVRFGLGVTWKLSSELWICYRKVCIFSKLRLVETAVQFEVGIL